MRYWLDEEFIERGPDYPLELISIGIVSQDRREYYAQSVEFSIDKASPWVRENVIMHLDPCPHIPTNSPYSLGTLYGAQAQHPKGRCANDCPWRTREQIRDDILAFMDPLLYGKPEIWTWYGAYDHVIFCQLFGTMMDLPKAYPMHTMDLEQWCKMLGDPYPRLPEQSEGKKHHALADARHNRVMWEFLDKLALDYEMLR